MGRAMDTPDSYPGEDGHMSMTSCEHSQIKTHCRQSTKKSLSFIRKCSTPTPVRPRAHVVVVRTVVAVNAGEWVLATARASIVIAHALQHVQGYRHVG